MFNPGMHPEICFEGGLEYVRCNTFFISHPYLFDIPKSNYCAQNYLGLKKKGYGIRITLFLKFFIAQSSQIRICKLHSLFAQLIVNKVDCCFQLVEEAFVMYLKDSGGEREGDMSQFFDSPTTITASYLARAVMTHLLKCAPGQEYSRDLCSIQ